VVERKSGHNDYRGIGGLFSQWKKLVFDNIKKLCARKDSAAVVNDQWKFTKLPNFLKQFCAHIYSADEIGLFYCVTLDASLS
jgi:hypothetical protein